ncbi:hypothetical protein [Candidatus Parabeggiatoa sp. HSG14]|uniref:hypothetical protein n=1 Tax=Candidatus Parabeggiatoa sp. HSG14 TaxID=3055593 RepID=UPI0025A71CA0|nr:hypothetical protein [Thiotrichales bacterium HSG14]
MNNKDDHAAAMLVQKHQLSSAENKMSELDSALDTLRQSQSEKEARLVSMLNDNENEARLVSMLNDNENEANLDKMLNDMEALLDQNGIYFDENSDNTTSETFKKLDSSIQVSEDELQLCTPKLDTIETIDFDSKMSWSEYVASIEEYAFKHNVDLTSDPYQQLMSATQRIELEKRIKDEFTLKTANCDKYDYMIAGTCGVIGGLIDVFLVGMPGKGKLTKVADNAVDAAVEKFASACGWKGARQGSNPTKSAIRFLEIKKNFKVNYDQTSTNGKNGTSGKVKDLYPKNHHIKSLGHSPDFMGCFFSILGQFTNTAHFVDGGKLLTVETKNFELQGSNFVAKIFSGFVNWLGHLFSDVAASSGTSGRGSGIPIPFYSLLQFVDVGAFGKDRQSFAKIAVQVFEKGYDFRHGLALAIPVLVTELLTRLMWVVKQHSYHKKAWSECLPSASNPELRRMLLIGHGSLCLIDVGDAALRSSGNMLQFLLRTNLVGWARFGTLVLKELSVWHNAGHIDADAVDDYLDIEYKRIKGVSERRVGRAIAKPTISLIFH